MACEARVARPALLRRTCELPVKLSRPTPACLPREECNVRLRDDLDSPRKAEVGYRGLRGAARFQPCQSQQSPQAPTHRRSQPLYPSDIWIGAAASRRYTVASVHLPVCFRSLHTVCSPHRGTCAHVRSWQHAKAKVVALSSPTPRSVRVGWRLDVRY